MKKCEEDPSEIIDYKRRQQAGKVIGSGRIEKGCDQVIGHRQKKKGMSWSEVGSKSLGILKVAELNNKWRELWFANEAANDPDINGIHTILALASWSKGYHWKIYSKHFFIFGELEV